MARVEKGKWFGSYVVLEDLGDQRFLCGCSCSIKRILNAKELTAYVGKSRNCRHHESRTGKDFAVRYHPLYPIWNGMMTRCYNKRHKDYPRYGARGIRVCERWHNFRDFIADMNPRPKGTQLDRIDGSGAYSPDNCYWATPQQNSRHRRSTRYITANGQTKSVAEWCDITGLSPQVIHQRIDVHGWTEQDAVTVLKRHYKPR